MESIFIAELLGGLLVKIGNFSINGGSNLLPAIPSSKQVDWAVKWVGLISFCETLVLASS
jgi:hypothetical protein